ncbi:MAG: hypothetical protein V4736_10180 [Bdellovibrionota bacterium]
MRLNVFNKKNSFHWVAGFFMGISQQSFLNSSFPLKDRHYPMGLIQYVTEKPDLTNSLAGTGDYAPTSDFVPTNFSKGGFVDFKARLALTKPEISTFNLSEAYYSYKQNQEFRIGRSLWDWNFIEDEFQLGIWEPLFKAETLRRERQGLTGAFWIFGEPENQVMFFASPIYIPSQGPSYVMNSQGQFENVNPWFNSPPRKVKLFASSTSVSDIQYNIHRPSEAEVVFNFSGGLWWRKQLSEKFRGTASFMRKPDNQLLLAVGGGYNVAADRGDVHIYPKIQKHDVSSIQLDMDQSTYQTELTYARLSYWSLFSDPTLTSTRFQSEVDVWAGRVKVPINTVNMSASYLWTSIRSLTDEGPLAFRRTALTAQLPITEAWRFGATFGLQPYFETLEGQLYYLWSQRNQLEQISFGLSSKWRENLVIFSKVELLQAAELTSENTNEISQSAVNDYVEVGALYEF